MNYCTPRPATRINPPNFFSVPRRSFLSKQERLSRSKTGASLLGDVAAYTPYAPPTKTPAKLPQATRTEYHRRLEVVPAGGHTRIFVPCARRPCYQADHYDTDDVMVRPRHTKVEVVSLPPTQGSPGAASTPSPASSQPGASRIDSAPVPRVQHGGDVVADIDALVAQWEEQNGLPPSPEYDTAGEYPSIRRRLVDAFTRRTPQFIQPR